MMLNKGREMKYHDIMILFFEKHLFENSIKGFTYTA